MELLTYADPQPVQQIPDIVFSVEDLLEEAAKIKYGERIRLLRTAATEAELQRFWNNLHNSIRPVDTKPREVGRSTVDVITKDYVNNYKQNKITSPFIHYLYQC